jgi:hypothetical protein
MDEKTMQEIFHEFISSLEALDTQNAAISQFLKDKGIAPQQELAPYLERAGKASSMGWLGTRVRIDYLFSSAVKEEEEKEEKDAEKKSSKSAGKTDDRESGTRSDAGEQLNTSKGESSAQSSANAEQDDHQQDDNKSSKSASRNDADAA